MQSSSPPLPPWKCNARTGPRIGERVSTGHKTRQWVRAANAGQHSRPSHPRLNPSDTTINFQGCPAHRAGQRGSHKPATAVVGSYSLVPALPTHERPSRGDAGHRRDRASPHPTPVSTLHALGACVSTTAWAAASPARGPPTRGGGRGAAAGPLLHLHLLRVSQRVRAHLTECARRLVVAHAAGESDDDSIML